MVLLHAKGGLKTRKGIPDGFGGKHEILDMLRTQGKTQAKELVQQMIDKELIEDSDVSRLAMESLVEMLKAPELYTTRDRLAAIRTALDFTKSKPTAKQEVTVRTAEQFLEEIADNDETSE